MSASVLNTDPLKQSEWCSFTLSLLFQAADAEEY